VWFSISLSIIQLIADCQCTSARYIRRGLVISGEKMGEGGGFYCEEVSIWLSRVASD
jgi:hypothetical protein